MFYAFPNVLGRPAVSFEKSEIRFVILCFMHSQMPA